MTATARSWPDEGHAAEEKVRLATSPAGRSALKRLHRFKAMLRRFLHLRSGIKIDGVYYKELTAMPLARALSQRGPGQKAYRVTFRDRSKQIIHATLQRHYGDLAGPVRLGRYEGVRDRLRPGMRVLDVGCGTGYTSAWLAQQVGLYGAVVALDADEESVTFAQRRYAVQNIAFELHERTSLDGETDESFDGVVWLQWIPGENDQMLRELWRVLTPGGWLLLGPAPEADGEAGILNTLQAAEPDQSGSPSDSQPATRAVIAARRGEDVLIEKVADHRS